MADTGQAQEDHIDIDPEVDSAVDVPLQEPSLSSLRSSILQYQKEHGRTYHAMSAGKYVFPNDERENDRLDMQDHLFLLTFGGKRALCPGADTAKRVLDMGTGTGIWAIEYADDHPTAEVIGVDLSPIQPSFVPPNCSFEIDDVEKEWTWSVPFDFVFSRMMTGSFADMKAMMEKVYKNLEPGGYFELQDIEVPVRCDDDTMSKESALYTWQAGILEASQKFGREMIKPYQYKEMLTAAGFEDVTERRFKWPSNDWPLDPKLKELGVWQHANTDHGLEGWTLALFTRALGWSEEQTLALCANVRKDIRNRKLHAYWDLYVVYGKKPMPV